MSIKTILTILTSSLVFSVFGSPEANAQTNRELVRQPALATAPEPRTALVIGNATYRNASTLVNPVNDARDMAAALKDLGFEVMTGENLTVEEMKRLVGEFGKKLASRKGVGLFFYAGHGIQINGRNYLIPVELKSLREQTIEFESLDVSRVLGEMDAAGSRLNMVILDACRSNPFEVQWRSNDQGLAEIRAPRGTLIAYATSPGKVASDGNGRNGTFTAELLKLIREPNILVETLFKRVGERVSVVSGGSQEPYLSQSIRGDFYFAVSPDGVPGIPSAPIQASPAVPTVDAETQLWQEAVTLNKESGYRLYLAEYPRGKYVDAAVEKLDLLKKAEAAKAEEEEREAWTEALKLNRRGSVQAYMNAYPNGRFIAQAKAKLIEFDKADEVAKWRESERIATEAAYRGYLNAYPKGEFAGLAKLRLVSMGILPPNLARPGTIWKTASGIELVYIPAGEFTMGSSGSDIKAVEEDCKQSVKNCRFRSTDEGPPRRVAIRDGFWMGKYEVTQGQWRAIMGENPSFFLRCGENCPVDSVSWEDAKKFIAVLNERNDGFIYSLPTEAEWEYAARSGTSGIRPGRLDETAWYADNSGLASINSTQVWVEDQNWDNFSRKMLENGNRTRPVGGKSANAWGLYDMLGNVIEWTEDLHTKDGYTGVPSDGSANLTKGDSGHRVVRGGSWIGIGNDARSAERHGLAPDTRKNYNGFRVVARPR